MKSLLCFMTTSKLFKYFKKRYKFKEIKLLNSFVSLKGKIRTIKSHIKFLKSCLQYRILPTYLNHRLNNSKVKLSLKIERAFISDELQHEYEHLDDLRRIYRCRWKEIRGILSFCDLLRLSLYISKIDQRLSEPERKRHDRKISFLVQKRYGKSMSNGDKHIINLSQHVLTEDEKFVIGHGLKYCVPPKSLDQCEILSEFEMLFSQLHMKFTPNDPDSIPSLKSKLAAYAYTYSEADLRNLSCNFHKEHFRAIKSLRTNERIVITRPDKGTAVCILDREDYVSKMNAILSDQSKFSKLGPAETCDKTASHEKRFCKDLNKIVKDGRLPKCVADEIKPVGSQRPRLYGLPKIHKEGSPLRPVLSAIGSPQYPVAKYLAKVLKPVVDLYSTNCISDSFAFANLINESNFTTSSVLCSYDIKSLFTNVPLSETIDICIKALYEDQGITPPPFDCDVFKFLIEFATTNIEFSFNNVMFRQDDGVGMGNPLGSCLANIFVGFYEKSLFNTYSVPQGYRRYVDDTFAIFDNLADSKIFLDRLNSLHPSLVFTCELEKDNALPFLDVLVKKESGQFVTSVYRKPTFTGQYQRWDSFCAEKTKRNLVSLLVHRAVKICSPCMLAQELENVRKLLQENGYPILVVNSIMKRKLASFETLPMYGPQKCPVYLRLPWIGQQSIEVSKLVKSAINSTYNAVMLRSVFTSKQILPCSQKDVLPSLQSSNIIYKFECAHCESVYVGKTTRRLQDRIAEHVPSFIRMKKYDQYSSTDHQTTFKSSIAAHLVQREECGRAYSTNCFSIMKRTRSTFHLGVMEAVCINKKKPILCRQKQFVFATKLFPNFLKPPK